MVMAPNRIMVIVSKVHWSKDHVLTKLNKKSLILTLTLFTYIIFICTRMLCDDLAFGINYLI